MTPTLAWFRRYAAWLISAAFIVGVGAGFWARQSSPIDPAACPSSLAYVKPEDDCGGFASTADRMQRIEDDLKNKAKAYTDSGRVSRISVVVRDLDSQRFAVVGPTDQYDMASLIKVPLAIAYFRLAELTPDLLSQKLLYSGAEANQYALQLVPPAERLQVGSTYTVRELIRRMLSYSDNAAAQMLSEQFVSYDYLQKILATLGLSPKPEDQKEYQVTARMYGGVMRSLFNSSFLSREYSNEILSYLADSSYTQGAPARLPSDMRIAHKFGEREAVDPATGKASSIQLHDCGIVYASSKEGTGPYSFCIMTEGTDLDSLTQIIQDLSLEIYSDFVR